MEISDKTLDMINLNYEYFKGSIVPILQEEIMERIMKINFYGAANDFINREHTAFDNQIVKCLESQQSKGVNILEKLWEHFLRNEDCKINNDSDMFHLLQSFSEQWQKQNDSQM